MFTTIIKYLGHLGNTFFGIYQESYCPKWDKELNERLDNLNFARLVIGGHLNLYLDDIEVWVNNKYYSYGFKCADIINLRRYSFSYTQRHEQRRPKFKTMLRLEGLVEHLRNSTDNTYRREG